MLNINWSILLSNFIIIIIITITAIIISSSSIATSIITVGVFQMLKNSLNLHDCSVKYNFHFNSRFQDKYNVIILNYFKLFYCLFMKLW